MVKGKPPVAAGDRYSFSQQQHSQSSKELQAKDEPADQVFEDEEEEEQAEEEPQTSNADDKEEDYSLKFSDKYHKKTRENQKVVE